MASSDSDSIPQASSWLLHHGKTGSHAPLTGQPGSPIPPPHYAQPGDGGNNPGIFH